MHNLNTKTHLPLLESFEEFEKFKLRKDILETITREIITYHHLSDKAIELVEGTNIVFFYGNEHVIKIYPPFHREQFTNEVLVIKHLKNKLSVKTPEIEFEGMISGWPYIITNRLDGVLLEGLWEKLDEVNKINIVRELGNLIREVHALPINGLEMIDCHWTQFISHQINQCVKQHQTTKLPDELIKQIPNYLQEAKDILPTIQQPVLLTGEYTPMNLLVSQKNNMWHINGMIDFGDCMLGLPDYDLLGPGAFLIQGNKKLLREFLMAYGYTSEKMTPLLSKQLTTLMLLHRYSNLKVQIRIANWKSKVSNIGDFEELVWGL